MFDSILSVSPTAKTPNNAFYSTIDQSYLANSLPPSPTYQSRFSEVAAGHRTPTFEVNHFRFPLPPLSTTRAQEVQDATIVVGTGPQGRAARKDPTKASQYSFIDMGSDNGGIDHRATTIAEEDEGDLEEDGDEDEVQNSLSYPSSGSPLSSSDSLSAITYSPDSQSPTDSYFDTHCRNYVDRQNSLASTNSTSRSVHELYQKQLSSPVTNGQPMEPIVDNYLASEQRKKGAVPGPSVSKLRLLLSGKYGASSSDVSLRRSEDSDTSSPSLSRRNSKKAPKKPFSRFAKPTQVDLGIASQESVFTEEGNEIKFGSLFSGQRTIVCFIRHYWCPSCQDYIASIMKISPEQLRQHNLKLVIVGCGSWKMISGYRRLLGGCPYPIVSDPGRTIYKQFGMTQSSTAPGKRPDYVQHNYAANTLVSLKRNLAMPLKSPGDLNALGGEFVVGPGLSCTYAHRMSNTRDHAELSDILKGIGVSLPTVMPERSV